MVGSSGAPARTLVPSAISSRPRSGYVDAGPTMLVGTCLGLVTIECICFGFRVAA